jgi:hypothetical protein
MKILHYFNTGGLGSVLAKYQQEQGHETQTFVRKGTDFFGFADLYPISFSRFTSPRLTVAQGLLKMRGCDLICVHSHDKSIPYIRRLYKKKPLWLFYHGTDIRGLWLKKYLYWSQADLIFCFTSDLMDAGGTPPRTWELARPVDRNVFADLEIPRRSDAALFFIKKYRSKYYTKYLEPLVLPLLQEHGLSLKAVKCDSMVIRHKQMPNLLNRFEYVIDIPQSVSTKDHVIKYEMSLIGLQALACGCKVLQPWETSPLTEFPVKHDAAGVAAELEHFMWKANPWRVS